MTIKDYEMSKTIPITELTSKTTTIRRFNTTGALIIALTSYDETSAECKFIHGNPIFADTMRGVIFLVP